MKKCRRIAGLFLICLLCLSAIQVHAEQTENEQNTNDEIAERIAKAESLGLGDWVDEEGYLIDRFYEDKNDGILTDMGLDGLVRTLSEEELEAYVSRLNAGIESYTVTFYLKVSQINPSTGRTLYTGFFEMDGIVAFCIERSMTTPAKGSSTGEWQAVTNDELRKVLYYGYNGPQACGYTYVETALAAAEANGDGDNSLGRDVLAIIREKASPPSSFKVWKVETNGGRTQDLAFYTMEQDGYGRVQKISDASAITNGNSCYSLQGAVYGIYEDAACTTEKGRVSTGADGYSGTISLPTGTYYVREITAPKGYFVSSEVKSMVISASNTTTVTMSDTPQTITPDVIIQKVDAQTGQNVPQGTGTLQGAQFSVKFYQGEYAEGVNPAAQGQTPSRQWIFATDASGTIRFQNGYLVSGEALWTNASGNGILPLGTVTVQEIKSSDGYRINSQVFVQKVSNSGDVFETINVSEPVITLELTKYREDTTQVLEGAVFEHISPDGGVEQKTTDADGKIVWKGLQKGTHEIREILSPTGYRDNQNVITFVVNENNEITVTSAADETYGAVRTSITADGNLVIEVEDKVGFKLPETGCAGALAMTASGVLLCMMALRKMLRSRRWKMR